MNIYFGLENVLVTPKLEWLPGAKVVFEEVKSFTESIGWEVKILAHYDRKKDGNKQERINWCQENLVLSKSDIKTIPNLTDMLSYATPENILIDSHEEITNGFLYSGGYSILYDSVATGVKKIQYLMDAVRALEAESTAAGKPENVRDAFLVMKARLKYLFRKINIEFDEDEYDYCRSLGYYEAESFLDFYYYDENAEEILLPVKFKAIVDLAFEQEYSQSNWSSQDFTEFPSMETIFSKYKTDLQKKLMDYYKKDFAPLVLKAYDIIKYGETIFGKAMKHIEHNQNLPNFLKLYREQQYAFLTFVYLNLAANMLQNELAKVE